MIVHEKAREMIERYIDSVEAREDIDDKHQHKALVAFDTLKALIDIIKSHEEDLNLVCRTINPCLVCGHYKPERQGMEKCELNGWKCAWEWRGMQNETISDRPNTTADGCVRS